MRVLYCLSFPVFLALSAACFGGNVVMATYSPDAALGVERITNPGLEDVADGAFAGWRPWESGYEIDETVAREGRRSALCRNTGTDEHRGLTYEVHLDQTEPVPIVARCFSRAENVSGGRDANYSLYLDLEYTDGTPLWGQVAPFRAGTHDWEEQTVTIFPTKPVKTVLVHGIFRVRSGTARFDGFSLREARVPPGSRMFDGTPVAGLPTPAAVDNPLGKSPALRFFVRDVGGASHFIEPVFSALPADGEADRIRGVVPELGLELTLTGRPIGPDARRIDGTVRDTTGKDRAVTVYLAHAPDAADTWHEDPRRAVAVEPDRTYIHSVVTDAGANRGASRYPFACVEGPAGTVAVGAPLDVPRLWRFAYDSGANLLYGAVDLGLSPDRDGSASFAFAAFRAGSPGFRSALARYYSLFPDCFTKRTTRDGTWMPFTDIAAVEGHEDFGFGFQEGAPNVAFDERNGVLSFVYVEPMSHWLAMPPETERTAAAANALLAKQAAAGERQSLATRSSMTIDEYGDPVVNVVQAPWCDGALYFVNPSPRVTAEPDGLTQFDHEWNTIRARFDTAAVPRGAWAAWEAGYEIAPGAGFGGGCAIRVRRTPGGISAGATQHVVLGQAEPAALFARVRTRAAGVTGEPDNNYALYIDLRYADGSAGWGFVASAQPDAREWQMPELRIDPPKPVHSLSYHLLFRAPHEGEAFFDDAFLGLSPDGPNLLRQGTFEADDDPGGPAPRLDGVYIDSFEMAATARNYRKEHLAVSELPPVFDADGRLCQLGIFTTLEFTREVARRMHESGSLMFANSTPAAFPWGAAYLDIMGTETNWAPGGEYRPDSDPVMLYRRALSRHRPYCLLLNTVFDDFPAAWVERYFKRCAAYGIFPGFFSHNAADDPYWTRPDLYNRDRALFRTWIPVIRELSEAGWEPVTHAVSSDSRILVERFGRPGGPLFLTLFNDSPETRSATVTVDAAALATGGQPPELATGPVTLAAEDVRVLRLAP